MSGDTITKPHRLSCAPSRAAREPGHKRSEFDRAVHLGRTRTVPGDGGGGGGRRVTHTEFDRLRSEDGFPQALRDSVRAVGTTEGAAVMDIPPSRFTRPARLGVPERVTFCLNRCRAVVWLYPADEPREFAARKDKAPPLSGRTPEGLRDQLRAGLDLRPRNWRGRHLGFLLRQADAPWERAGAVAALLGPVQIAEIARDPYERTHLTRFRPGPPAHGAPGSPSAHVAERIMTADDPDEISRLRADLTQVLDEARRRRPAPRPKAKQPEPATAPESPRPQPRSPEPGPSRGLLGRLCRSGARPTAP